MSIMSLCFLSFFCCCLAYLIKNIKSLSFLAHLHPTTTIHSSSPLISRLSTTLPLTRLTPATSPRRLPMPRLARTAGNSASSVCARPTHGAAPRPHGPATLLQFIHAAIQGPHQRLCPTSATPTMRRHPATACQQTWCRRAKGGHLTPARCEKTISGAPREEHFPFWSVW